MNFTHKDVLNMLSAIHAFTDETALAFNSYDNEPSGSSIAMRELKSFPNSELVKDVHYRGILSIESAADHLMVFADSFAEPAKTIAPATCVRGLLESCALASWFLAPEIDAKTRVGRCFAFRHLGLIQQIKFFQVEDRQAEINKAKQRIIQVEQVAVSLGYQRLLTAKGDIRGIGQPMPGITDLISQTLHKEAEYRLLSGIAHGHHWATQGIGFRVIEYENTQGHVDKALEKHLHPTVVLYLALIAVSSFARVQWNLWRLYGWNLNEIKRLLDDTYKRLNYKDELRFWHAA